MGSFKERRGMVRKPLPPIVKQPQVFDSDLNSFRISNTCWAAALSSWLKVSRDENWSVEDLVTKFGGKMENAGLNLLHFDAVAESYLVRMDYQKIAGDKLTWEYL